MLNVKLLNDNYELKDKVNELTSVKGYPHILIGKTDSTNVFIKKLGYGEQKVRFLEEVYLRTADLKSVNVPMVNRNSKYITVDMYDAIVLFEKLHLNESTPSATWWAKVLLELHFVTEFQKKTTFRLSNSFNKAAALLKESQNCMDSDIHIILNQLLQSISKTKEYNVWLVLNHGDPLESNVLKKGDAWMLIDFESACIAPREYDIQRRLWDQAINSNSIDGLEEYWNEFCREYESNDKQLAINMELLADLYVIDFCETMSWLCLVSNNAERDDYERQRAERDLFINALNGGRVHAMLKFIQKRG